MKIKSKYLILRNSNTFLREKVNGWSFKMKQEPVDMLAMATTELSGSERRGPEVLLPKRENPKIELLWELSCDWKQTQLVTFDPTLQVYEMSANHCGQNCSFQSDIFYNIDHNNWSVRLQPHLRSSIWRYVWWKRPQSTVIQVKIFLRNEQFSLCSA